MVTGSLQERNGKYTAVLNLYENGRRKQKSIALGIPVKGNKRKALEMLEELKRQYSGEGIKDLQIKKDSPLFADFLKDWLKITAPTIERTTYQSYESMINARLDGFFRMLGVTLAQVEPSHIRALHDSIFKDDCNANTVIHYHAIVRKALQYAVKNEMISKNPADMVDRPKVGKYVAEYYNEDELAALFEATKHDSMAVVIQLAAYYGLRRSEVLGIRWSAIDFQRGTISINHKVTEGKAEGQKVIHTEDKLKTKSSFRTLPLIPEVRTLLQDTKERQEYHRRLFKKSYDNTYSDYVCVDEMGKLFRPNYITDHFGYLLKRYKFRKIRFHDLRHSCASLLLARGIPMKAIQEWLGHSTFATTADTYSHLDFSSKQESAKAISAAFGKQEEPITDEPEREEPEVAQEEEQKLGMTMSMM
jgi:integrase